MEIDRGLTVPSSRMTLSPKTLTSMAPLDRSTNRVRISRIALDRALTSMAHIPSTIGCRERSVTAEISECEPLGEGVWDRLVSLDDDLGDVDNGSEVLNSDIREREFLSQ